MESIERRGIQRHILQIPVVFRLMTGDDTDSVVSSEIYNISGSGVFLKSPVRLQIGEPVRLTLRVPSLLSGITSGPRQQLETSGEVVHERVLPNGTLGYGVKFSETQSFRNSSDPPTYAYA